MTLQEQFFKASGIDLSDKEVSGKTPYLKDGKWSSMERGAAWQKYAKWLEDQIPLREEEAFKAGWYLSSQVVNNSENICDSMLKEWKEVTK